MICNYDNVKIKIWSIRTSASTVSYQYNCESRYYYKNVLFYFVQLSFNGYSKTMIDLHLIAVTKITRMQNHDHKNFTRKDLWDWRYMRLCCHLVISQALIDLVYSIWFQEIWIQ